MVNPPSRRVLPPWPAVVTLAGGASYLAWRWNDIPPIWVVHWNAAGVANGWAERTVPGVFGLLALGAGILLLTESIHAILGADPSTEPVRAATRHALRVLTFAVSLVLTLIAIDLPLGPRLAPGVLVFGTLAVLVVAGWLGWRRTSEATHLARQSDKSTELEGYHAIYYSNPNDDRLWVPKRRGVGITINFAHPWAWPAMIALVGVPIAFAFAATQCR